MHQTMNSHATARRVRLVPDRAAWTDFSGWDYKSYAD